MPQRFLVWSSKKGFGRLMTLEHDLELEEEINNVYDNVFEKFDEDHNGTLDRKEFRSLMKEIMQAVARGIGNSPVHVALE
ncbi:hypothetical protein L1049_002807 [Liquidambar formosana]|uniref:EF-hand domain-containing protein n=1 Tax=Liquidambar formosana TaxID=63359 RepID=A0AAP0NL05_LIQFO